jgi:LmbE family N-acetylglucosaminyl deacetylase
MTEALVDEPPASALAIYAHPDDPAISCGGTLACWAAGGSTVHVVICTAGDKGTTDPGTDPDALAQLRVVEAERSAELLGVRGTYFLGRLDGELENDAALRRELVEIIRDLRPEAIVSPDPLAVFFGEHHYNHRDHRVVGWAALDAAAPAAALPLYFKGTGTAHQVTAAYLSGSLQPSVWVDVTSTIDRKIEAVSCHVSQLVDAGDWIASALRDGAEDSGRDAGVDYAEPFRRIWLAP